VEIDPAPHPAKSHPPGFRRSDTAGPTLNQAIQH